jgi:hypothetical protein
MVPAPAHRGTDDIRLSELVEEAAANMTRADLIALLAASDVTQLWRPLETELAPVLLNDDAGVITPGRLWTT